MEDLEHAVEPCAPSLSAAESALAPSLSAAESALALSLSAAESAFAPSLSAAESALAPSLSAAQSARAERNRQRARALRDSRLASRATAARAAAADSGGGFLVQEEAAAPRPAPRPAPVLDPAERPHCCDCGRPFAASYLLDEFDHPACDDCRDESGAHALLTRTEAKAEFLLRDEDLDARPAALRCVRRRNPHSARGDMRLYLRAQVEARALLVWQSAARLEEEREARAARRERGRARRGARALRALRLEVRSALARAPAAPHQHRLGAEQHDAERDVYSRACACGYVETYEKM